MTLTLKGWQKGEERERELHQDFLIKLRAPSNVYS